MTKWFAVFKTGKHTNSKGIQKEYNTSDLDGIVNRYKPEEYEAPIVVGHPKTDSPAYGWIEKLKRVGDVLYAYPKQVVQEFADAVKQGLYKNRSVALNADGSLRHVGFLGATPPAVTGLPPVEFKGDDDPELIEFENSEAEYETVEAAVAEALALAEAEKTFLKNKIAELEANPAFHISIRSAAEAESKFEAALATVTKTIQDKASEELQRLSLQIRKAEFEQFLNEQIAYGNVLPASLEPVSKILESLSAIELSEKDGAEVFEFSDGTAASPVEFFKGFIKGLPKIIEFSETATGKNNNPAPDSLSATQTVAEEIRKQMSG